MPYRHEALFFVSQEALLEAGVPWLREGLDAGEVIALACEADNNAVLAAALGDHPAVRVLPQDRIYHKAIDAVAFYHDLFTTTTAADHARVRVLGEVGFGTTVRARGVAALRGGVQSHPRVPAAVEHVRLLHPRSAPVADRHRPGHPPLAANRRRHHPEPRLRATRSPAQRRRPAAAHTAR